MELCSKLPSPVGMTRPALLDLLLREEYGFLPPAPKALEVEETNYDRRHCAGKAPLRELKFTAHCEFGEFSFPVQYFCPKSDKLLEPIKYPSESACVSFTGVTVS